MLLLLLLMLQSQFLALCVCARRCYNVSYLNFMKNFPPVNERRRASTTATTRREIEIGFRLTTLASVIARSVSLLAQLVTTKNQIISLLNNSFKARGEGYLLCKSRLGYNLVSYGTVLTTTRCFGYKVTNLYELSLSNAVVLNLP